MEIFKFEKNVITNYIQYELKTVSKFKEPLNYIIRGLEKLGHSITIKSLDKSIDLNKIKEKEGKNYHWSSIKYKNVDLVIRRYHQHLTIFTKVNKEKIDYMGRPKIEYGAFTFHTDFEKFGDKHDEMMDKYYDKPFTDLNVIIKDLINLLLNRGVSWVWNSACLARPDHVELKLAFENDEISSIDEFVFCMEEIENAYLSMFAETTMFQILEEYKSKTGEMLDKRYKAGKVNTVVKDEYFHGAGMEVIDTMDKKNKAEFKDVYSLTRWYFEEIFKNRFFLYNGEVYVKDVEFKEGDPVAYNDENLQDEFTFFEKKFDKKNFIPLKKY